MEIYFLVQYFHICWELELLKAPKEYAHEMEFSDFIIKNYLSTFVHGEAFARSYIVIK